tara:strand:- start:1484 stop:1660 length:177 start_codon:yes stop_codon:yes gene_type:complete
MEEFWNGSWDDQDICGEISISLCSTAYANLLLIQFLLGHQAMTILELVIGESFLILLF